MLNIKISDFFTLFTGHWCDWDGAYGNQCVDLVQFWNKILGGSPFTGNAKDIYNQPQTIYVKVPNTPTGVPVEGDIPVWDGAFNGGPGHVGVATKNCTINTLEVVEQNDPLNKNVQVKQYDYSHVIGWLHPKALPTVGVDQKYADTIQTIKSVIAQAGV